MDAAHSGAAMKVREVRCGACGTLNRVPAYSLSRIPRCGKCHANLPEAPFRKALRSAYRRRYWAGAAVLALLAALYAWQPLAPAPPSQTTFGKDDIVVTCDVQPTPDDGVYQDFLHDERVASFTIKTAAGSDYFVKLEEASVPLTAMTFFVRGNSTLRTKVPLGSYVLKYATGRLWCGDKALFGQETVTRKAEDIFSFERSRTTDGYSTTAITVELILQRGGNLRTTPISREEF